MKAYKIMQTIFNNDDVKIIVKKEDLLNVKNKVSHVNFNSDNEKDNLDLSKLSELSEVKTLKLEQKQYLELVESSNAQLEKLSAKNDKIKQVVFDNAQNHISFLLVEEKNYKMLPELLGMFDGEKYDKVSAIILN
jgi:hypothetical protein